MIRAAVCWTSLVQVRGHGWVNLRRVSGEKGTKRREKYQRVEVGLAGGTWTREFLGVCGVGGGDMAEVCRDSHGGHSKVEVGGRRG